MNLIKKLSVVVCLAAILAIPARRADAVIGTIDNVPAATLLLPYFEVNLNDPNGLTTLVAVNNSSATAILAHVTLWSDLGVPTFAFNIYLTGYDVQTINLRDIFNGFIARTASAGQDPTDTISPHGDFSQDINFASCNGQLPLPAMTAEYVAHVRNAHTGLPSTFFPPNNCSGLAYGDNIARGYVTVETVNNCTLRVAGEPGYFGPGGTGDATNQNVLWGDYFYVDPGNNFAQGDTLVHIEASATDPATSVVGRYTFYGSRVSWTAADNREPLGAKFGARFVSGGTFTGGTTLQVWRDSKVAQDSFTCPVVAATRPAWYPLAIEDKYYFDEQENATSLAALASPFGASTQRVAVNSAALPVAAPFGWLYLNLNGAVAAAGANPPIDPLAEQAWVSNVMSASGRFSVGQNGVVLQNATATTHLCIGGGGAPPCS